MLNKELISASIPAITLGDSVEQALQWMSDYKVSHLPVIEKEKYVGLVSEDDLLNAGNDQDPVSTLVSHFSRLSVNANTHFLEAVQMANEYGLTVIPVIDKDAEWTGSIPGADLLKYLGRIAGVDEPGGLIILELDKKSFSFSEISKLVETNDAHVKQLNTYYDNNQDLLYVTLKINKFEISDIVATFQRYEYHVKYYFGEELYENELKTNYDHLMNYLNI